MCLTKAQQIQDKKIYYPGAPQAGLLKTLTQKTALLKMTPHAKVMPL
jgi:hypothetical protein